MRTIRVLEAQKTYFLARKNLGTIRTQEIQISILFPNLPKLDRLNPQMEFYKEIWYPRGGGTLLHLVSRLDLKDLLQAS